MEDGAALIDIGAESSRPGHEPVGIDEEWSWLEPVLCAVRDAIDVPITVDTTHAEVAERAFAAGADALNDISGLHADSAMAPLLARSGCPAVLMHNQRGREFSGDVIASIRAGLEESLAIAERAGVDGSLLVLDPGFGFGWEVWQNLEMLRRLGELRALGRPLLVGASRKSTIGAVLDRPQHERQWGTAATVALAVQAGVDIVRVHDVREMVEVARMADAVVRGWSDADRVNRDAGAQTRTVWLALGANLGDRVANLAAGLDALAAGGVEIDGVSAVYDTPSWGVPAGPEQPRFANIAAGGRTALTAHDLLALCKRIEAAAGRDFDAPRNSARPLDVDILMIEGEMLSGPDLVVPHPRMHERAFVLVPLAEIAPAFVHPGLDRAVSELLTEVDRGGVEALEAAGWWQGPTSVER